MDSIKHPKPTKKYDVVQSIFDGFSKRNAAILHKSSTSPNLDSRCSSVTMEQQPPDSNHCYSDDIQSIQIPRDIDELLSVNIEDTVEFVPNVQYGKVLQVLSGSECVIASRIYNGYTKVLRPQLYKFRIKLRGVECDEHDETMRNELASMILNKIVILYQLTLEPSPQFSYCCLGAEVYLGNLHINHMMKNEN